MIYVSLDNEGNITGVFANPQPDALDAEGNVLCAGIPTEPRAEDDPDVIAHLARRLT